MNPTEHLSPRQWQTLVAVCDAFIPALPPHGPAAPFWARAASDLRVPRFVAEAMATLPDAQLRQFRQLLDLLGSPLADWRLSPIQARDEAGREALLRGWAHSPIPLKRQGFQALKRLATFAFYALTDSDGQNPNWAAIGYEGPLSAPPSVAPTLTLSQLDGASELACDVVVVGSGAGGGVVAGELARAGARVIVLEKGGYYDRADFTQRELEGMQRLYEARGMLASTDLGILVLAGACVGGGTTVNWAGSFRTPPAVLDEWATVHGLSFVRSADFAASFAAVEARLDVDTDESPCNPQNEALWRGCTALGYEVRPIPRNVRGCEPEACGYCGFGCQHGAKQGVLWTYLADAQAHGARLFANAEVQRVLVEDGLAVGVMARIEGREVRVRARRVVVAAGAIHSPAVLLRSGLRHPHLGRHLTLHPTVAVAARYAQRMVPWKGVQMAVVSDEFTALDGAWGVKIETPPAHPGLTALALPWESGVQHKAAMLDAAHLGNFIVLTRDRFGGRITLARDGAPLIHYTLSRYDRRHLIRGVREAACIHQAAGAEEIFFPQARLRRFHCGSDDLERFCADLERWEWGANQFSLFSAHQMGSCRMGGDPARHVLTPEAESREVRHLYVTDASAFPSASGANPMLTIQALAHHAAQGIARRL